MDDLCGKFKEKLVTKEQRETTEKNLETGEARRKRGIRKRLSRRSA